MKDVKTDASGNVNKADNITVNADNFVKNSVNTTSGLNLNESYFCKSFNNSKPLTFLQFIAVFMCVLVITLPFYSINVLAVGTVNRIHSFTITSSSGLSGYASNIDSVTISADIELQGRDVSPGQVYFERSGRGSYFTSCIPDAVDKIYTCTVNDELRIAGGSVLYTLTIFESSSSSNQILTQTYPLFIDTAPPDITINSYDRSGPNLTVSFTIKDTGSGIYDYSVRLGNYNTGLITVGDMYSDTPVNEFSDTIDIPIDTFPSGEYDLIIWANDRLGHGNSALAMHESEAIETISIDNTGPIIKTDTLSVKDQSGSDVSIISEDGTELDISITVEDENLDISSVIADFSNVGGNDNDHANCQANGAENKLYTCTWENVNVNRSGSVTFFASDIHGTETRTTVAIPLTIDTSGPVFGQLFSNHFANGKIYFGNMVNQLTLPATEQGIGLRQRHVWLNLAQLGLGNSVQADNCYNTTSLDWTCYWNITIDSDINDLKEIYLIITGDSLTDDLGNKGTIIGDYNPSYDIPVYIDTTPPLLDSIDVYSPIHNNYPVEGDTIVLSAHFILLNQEENEFESPMVKEFALVNISNIVNLDDISSAVVEADICYNSEDMPELWTCNWTVEDVIATDGPVNLYFNITDAAGNPVNIDNCENCSQLNSIFAYPVNVYGFSDDNNARRFSVNVLSSIPNKVDRKVVTQLEGSFNMFKRITITPSSEACVVAESHLESCEGNNGIEITQFGNLLNVSDYYLRFEIQSIPQEYLASSPWPVNCTLSIDGVCGNSYINDELHNVTLNIDLYNNELGDIPDKLYDKMKDAVWFADSSWTKYVTTVSNIVKYLQNFCTFYKRLSQINELINKFNGILYGALMAYRAIGGNSNPEWKNVRDFGCKVKYYLGGEGLKSYIYDNDDNNIDINKWGFPVSEGSIQEAFSNHPLTSTCALVTCAQCNPTLDWFNNGDENDPIKIWTDESAEKVIDWTSRGSPVGRSRTLLSYPVYLSTLTGHATDNPPQDLVEADLADLKTSMQASLYDPSKSIITAVRCRCMPAILLHLEMLRQLECKYLWCMQIQTSIGAPITACEEQLKVDRCMYVWNSLIYGFPLTNALRYMTEYFRSIIAYLPAVAMQKFMTFTCGKEYVDAQRALCNGPEAGPTASSIETDGWAVACGIADATVYAVTASQMWDNALDFKSTFQGLKTADFCAQEGVEEIISELTGESEN